MQLNNIAYFVQYWTHSFILSYTWSITYMLHKIASKQGKNQLQLDLLLYLVDLSMNPVHFILS
jgi:hypothetical protein